MHEDLVGHWTFSTIFKSMIYLMENTKKSKIFHLSFSSISEVTSTLEKHQRQLTEVESQQRRMLETVRREARALETRRRSLQRQLEMERARLAAIEDRMRELTGVTATDDDGGVREGDGDGGGDVDGGGVKRSSIVINLVGCKFVARTAEAAQAFLIFRRKICPCPRRTLRTTTPRPPSPLPPPPPPSATGCRRGWNSC